MLRKYARAMMLLVQDQVREVAYENTDRADCQRVSGISGL